MVDNEMNKDNAMQIISRACVNYKGTLQEHQVIQEALIFFENCKCSIEPKKEE